MLRFTHFIFGALGVAAILASAVFGGAAWQLFDPDRDIASRLTTYFFPASARRDDFVGRGWLYHKLQFLCGAIAIAFWIVFGVTS